MTECFRTTTRSLENLSLPVNAPCVVIQHIEVISTADGELSRNTCGHMAAGCRYACEYCYRARENFLNINPNEVCFSRS